MATNNLDANKAFPRQEINKAFLWQCTFTSEYGKGDRINNFVKRLCNFFPTWYVQTEDLITKLIDHIVKLEDKVKILTDMQDLKSK